MDDVTHWVHRLSTGDERAAQQIWEAYFDKLMRLARRRLEGMPRRDADEEDVALSAMNSFFSGAKAGRFPQLNDRTDVWKLLVTITLRKAFARQKRHHAEKRGGGRQRGESVFHSDADAESAGIEQYLAKDPTPEAVAIMTETCNDLLNQLGDETLRTIALYKFEGYTNEEIAQKIGCVERTVERKMARIRDKWDRFAQFE
jgi:RNA polymerase sigma factor (sigma-70 family)